VSADRYKDLNILLEKFKNGDQRAFEEIYRRCYGHIAFVCSKLCDNNEDVEEIVQDTFMAAFKQADTLKGDTLLALLRKVAARRCYDKHRKSQREPIVYSDEAIDVEDFDEDFLPEEYLQNKESQTNLLRIINELPTKQREMIYLYYYADINTEEIARLNNCSSVNVRKILFKARQTIKSKLGTTMSGVSLSSLLLAEEGAFVGSLSAVGQAAGTTTTGIFAAAASVVAVGIISAAVYFAVLPNMEIHETEEPTIAVTAPILEEAIEIEEEKPFEEESIVIPEASEVPKEIAYEAYEPTQLPLPQEYTPQEHNPPPPNELEEPEEPEKPEEIEDEPYEDEPPYIPAPIPTDRTPQILAALAIADSLEEINHITAYYGFSLSAQMWRSTDEQFRFYVTDEGSGDILIGITEYESDWRMKFEHFENAQSPLDRLDLFRWMEE